MKSFAIIGLGLFGTQLARDLYDAGHNVLAIDMDEERVENIADYVTQAVSLDAKNRELLAQVGIQKYDCVVMSITGDLATSVLITMNLKALGVPQIICKVQNETDREILEILGASYCLIPEHIAANKMAKKLTSRNIIDFTQLSDEYSIMELAVPSSWVGKSIIDINIRVHYGVNVIGKRSNGSLEVTFDPKVPFQAGEELIVIGSNRNLDKLQKTK
ncbi:MAG: potassium channel family protein [Lachnospiraceae bacterium]